MKHIRKVAQITLILNEKFGLDAERVEDFIDDYLGWQDRLEILNKKFANTPIDIEHKYLRSEFKRSFIDFIKDEIGIEQDKIAFSNNPAEIPIKINLGLKYANHSDDVSFVINL